MKQLLQVLHISLLNDNWNVELGDIVKYWHRNTLNEEKSWGKKYFFLLVKRINVSEEQKMGEGGKK